MRVRDAMTAEVATVGPDAALKEVAAVLVDRHISGLPVVDDAGCVLGVVSEGDIVQKEAGGRRRPRRLLRRLDLERGEIRAKLAARTAGEAMTAPAVTIEADRPVTEAALLMVENGIKRLPVVSGGELVGIVSRADLVRAFMRSDEDVAREIREEVALGTFAVPPESLHVEVHGGEVVLGGEVETSGVADLLAAFVKRVPGVVSVSSHLTHRNDGKVASRP